MQNFNILKPIKFYHKIEITFKNEKCYIIKFKYNVNYYNIPTYFIIR